MADIVQHLKNAGICCLTVFEGEGPGHFVDRKKEWPSLNHPFSHRKIAKIEIVVSSIDVEKVINIIHEQGKTGSSGDGLIYVTDVSRAVRVKDCQRIIFKPAASTLNSIASRNKEISDNR